MEGRFRDPVSRGVLWMAGVGRPPCVAPRGPKAPPVPMGRRLFCLRESTLRPTLSSPVI